MNEREVASVYDFTCSIYNKTGNGFFFGGGGGCGGGGRFSCACEVSEVD